MRYRYLFIYIGKVFISYYHSLHWLSCVRLLIPLFHEKNPIAENEIELLPAVERISKFSFRKKIIHEDEYDAVEKMILVGLDYILHNTTVVNRYTKTMMITLRIVLQSGYAFEETSNTTFNMLMTCFIMFAGWIYVAYIFIVIMNVITASESSEIKFEEIRREIRAFCKSSSLSSELTDRIQVYVKLKYQKHYFNEHKIQKSIPRSLRREIMMNSCAHFVSKIAIFRDLPMLLLEQIIVCLEMEIFFPGDVIIEADSIGDCMFFISYGTASIYSKNGDLVSKISDGAHFGEISLLTRGNKRNATVKAEEVCETYKLSRRDFRKVIEPHPEIFRHFEQIAQQRIKMLSSLKHAFNV